jgi:hypothetical protein
MKKLLTLSLLGLLLLSGCEMAGGAARDAHNLTGAIVDLIDPLADKAEWGRIQRESNRTQAYFQRHQRYMK